MASSHMTMKQLKAVCDAYQQRAEKAESHCLALTRERDAANNEIRRLRSALNCIAWPSSWANIPSSLITPDYMRHLAQDALAIGVRAANARAEAAAKCALDDANRRLQRWREYAIDCGGHVCACIGCDNPGLVQVEEGLWCCPRCAKRNGYKKESCL